MDLVIANRRWPRFGENGVEISKAFHAGKEATMNIVSSARFTMKKLLREGVPIAVVARRLGVCRQTIYNWMKAGSDEQRKPGERVRSSKLDPYREHISSRLDRFDLPATVLFREIAAMGYTGGITILRKLVAQIKAGVTPVEWTGYHLGDRAVDGGFSFRTGWGTGRRGRSGGGRGCTSPR